jgi:hypothetical protein
MLNIMKNAVFLSDVKILYTKIPRKNNLTIGN